MEDVSAALEPVGDGVRIRLRLVPRSSRAGVAGLHGGALKVRVCAPPVDGRANEEAIALLARLLHVPRSAVSLEAGQRSKDKVVRVEGLRIDEVSERLATG